jgi:hypothetical protein
MRYLRRTEASSNRTLALILSVNLLLSERRADYHNLPAYLFLLYVRNWSNQYRANEIVHISSDD